MSRIVVITGTDTGIGKTWVGCRLAESAKRAGTDVRAIKLVETGTAIEPEASEDGVLLARAAGQDEPVAALRRFRTPVAAAEAADREGAVLDFGALLGEAMSFARVGSLTLLEGAGGLLAPITWDTTIIDVAKATNASALLVAADRLGTINHTLLTLAALERAGVPCPAIILNQFDSAAGDRSVGSNAASLHRLRHDIEVIETNQEGWEQRALELLPA